MRIRTKILVVDDSPDFQRLVKAFVTGAEYLVITAGDTLQATGSALRDKPSLIVLDIGLPGGDGWVLLERLKSNSNTRNIPIVVVTGQSQPGLAEKAQAKGATTFLNKPVDKATLLTTFERLLTVPAAAPVSTHPA